VLLHFLGVDVCLAGAAAHKSLGAVRPVRFEIAAWHALLAALAADNLERADLVVCHQIAATHAQLTRPVAAAGGLQAFDAQLAHGILHEVVGWLVPRKPCLAHRALTFWQPLDAAPHITWPQLSREGGFQTTSVQMRQISVSGGGSTSHSAGRCTRSSGSALQSAGDSGSFTTRDGADAANAAATGARKTQQPLLPPPVPVAAAVSCDPACVVPLAMAFRHLPP